MYHLTQEQRNKLIAKSGSQTVNFWADVLNKEKSRVKRIKVAGNISLDADASIARTASLTIAEKLNWMEVTIKVIAEVDGDEYSLGVFSPTSPTERIEATGATVWEVDCYDQTGRLKQAGVSEPEYYELGTRYDAVINYMIEKSGGGSIIWSSLTNAAFPSARTFEEGESRLTIINKLLDEINFDPVYADENGNFIIRRHKEVDPQLIDETYEEGELSVLGPSMTRHVDNYGIPNVFTVTVENPDLNKTIRSVYRNEDPMDEHSIPRRGYEIVMKVSPPNVINDQTDLDIWLKRKVKALSAVQDTLEFDTLMMPIHGHGDTIAIQTEKVTGIFLEKRWSITLEAGTYMRHTVRREI